MTNEEKARELDKKFREAMFSPKEYHFTDCLLEMAQWKDEQVAEKCKYFLDHTCFGGYYNRQCKHNISADTRTLNKTLSDGTEH